MKIRKVVAAGNRPAPTMEIVEEEAITASLVDGEPSQPLSSPNHRRPEELAREVTWTWKRQSLQGLHPKINLYYRKKVFEDIRSVLTAVGGEKTLQQFCDGCFGHLMHFIGGTSCNRALHELISHEINLPGAREDELWFHISRTNIRFSPAEYALVTGLHFGSSSFDPLGSHSLLPNGVFERFCSGHPFTIKELWERFNSQSLRGSAEDYLKVAHILALYLMALGYNPWKKTEEWVWVLVEDLDLWNRFPWGAYTYQALMHFVSILPKTRDVLGSAYELLGPVWALQIWAYESIPQLGNKCALVTGQVTIPRCLKWSFPTRTMSFTHFFEQELVCYVTLDPTDEEQLQAYWVSVQTPRPLGVRYNPPRCLIAAANQANVPILSDDTSSTDGSTDSPPRQKRTRASIRPSPETFDEARFMDRVSSRVIEHGSQQLIPQVKQWMDDLYCQVNEQLETMRAERFLYAKPPGYNVESAKASEIAHEIIKEEKSLDRGSSSMLDTDVAGRAKPFPNEESGLKRDCPLTVNRAQIGSCEVTWTWKRQPLQGLCPRVYLYYRKKVLEDIKSVLTAFGGKNLLQQFCDGCFGHLMHFVGGTSSIKALHEFMSREINLPGAREDELWFHISGTNIRFSPAEYALVTGLRFGSSSFDPLGGHKTLPDGVFERFCSGRPITIKELQKRFKSQSVCGSAEDYLKVAHVLALYLMALGYDQRKTIDKWVWVLVEDLDLWNRFPWGAYTYQALIHFASILPRTRAVLGPTYEFFGPVWALQIWAYESIPQLGNACALVTGQVTIPRCLKWSFISTNMSFTHFFEQELVCCVTLDPTNEEQLQEYWVSVQTPEPLGVRYIPRQRLITTANRAKVSLPSDDTSSTDGSTHSPPRQMGTRASARLCPEIFDDARFVDRVSSRVIDHLSQQLIPQMKQGMDDLYRQVHDQLETMRAERCLYAKTPGYSAESAKAAEIADKIIKEEQSLYGGSSSMSDTGVAGWAKPFPNEESGLHRDCPLTVNRAQIGSCEPLKWELNPIPLTILPLGGILGEADASCPFSSMTTKKKKYRRSPSSREETSDGEGSESPPGKERRKKSKR